MPLPAEKAKRYKNHAGKSGLICGLRPEHIFEERRHLEPGQEPFQATPEVVEPMGNENLVYFPLDGAEVCARVNPGADPAPGRPLRLVADMRHVHLIDDATGKVL